MQANVKEILTAADAIEGINTVKDRPIIRQDDFPAFVILGRSRTNEAGTTNLAHYNGAWEYQCMIAVAMDKSQVDDVTNDGDDFVLLESYFTAFLNAFLGVGVWELVGDAEFGPYGMGGREVLGVAFTLAKNTTERYGD